MKKKFLLLLLTLVFPFVVNAASITVSGNGKLSPGETSTLKLIVSSTKNIYGGQVNFKLDSADFEIVSGSFASSYTLVSKNNGLVVYSTSKAIPNKATLATIKVKAKSNATVGNKAQLNLNNIVLTTGSSIEDSNDETGANTSFTLTVAPAKSSNNNLKELTIDGYSISFNKNTKSYNIRVGKDVKSLSIKALAEDENAKVYIRGNTNLKEGKNTITITVTAENGSKNVYYVYVTKEASTPVANTDCDLKSLVVKGYNINFDPNILEYRITVPSTVTNIELSSTLANPESTKTTDGPNTLAFGENVYTITVTDKNGNKKVYKVIVAREKEEKECETCQVCDTCEEKSDTLWKAIAIILMIVAIAETIYMVTMRDRKEI